jgi:hypothetical protein
VTELESVLRRVSAEALVLHQHGYIAHADSLARVVAGVRAAAREYLTWISEEEAVAYSGRSVVWLRAHRKLWEQDGVAEKREKGWFYCRLALPRRPQSAALDAIREEARRLASRHRRGDK